MRGREFGASFTNDQRGERQNQTTPAKLPLHPEEKPMKRFILVALLGATTACASMMTPHTDRYKHPGADKATQPFQFAFDAPNRGYLFPFQDMVVEVVF